jgi:release factor glutamine methyltransferase
VSATLRDLVLGARERLTAAGIDANEAAMDAAMLARHVLEWDLARFIAHETEGPPERFPAAFESVVERREQREPMSAITGRREFWALEFEVCPDVLTPRPETEIIVEEATACLAGLRPDTVARFPSVGWDLPPPPGYGGHAEAPGANAGGPAVRPLIVDVGTGSGCLAVCLAREFPGARVIATDVSPEALAIAARNARRHGVADRVEFRQTHLLAGVGGPAALIVSNPPYIPSGDIAGLPPEVRAWEPRRALDGGPDGLAVVRDLLAAAPSVLAPGGWLIMEFGYGQQQRVEALVRASPLELVRIANDLQQIPRTLVARMPDQAKWPLSAQLSVTV